MNASGSFPSSLHAARIAAMPSPLASPPRRRLVRRLPTLEDPSRGTGSGIMQTLRNYALRHRAADCAARRRLDVRRRLLPRLHALRRDSRPAARHGAQFSLTVAVGAILLVVGIWLLTRPPASWGPAAMAGALENRRAMGS